MLHSERPTFRGLLAWLFKLLNVNFGDLPNMTLGILKYQRVVQIESPRV